ncbi:hypothetical protein ERE_05820 [Agathobacter rectalis M104/1]|nr:hypothetical protein ERE_05820 [Agathobacter rectalis M104/1]
MFIIPHLIIPLNIPKKEYDKIIDIHNKSKQRIPNILYALYIKKPVIIKK